MVPFVQTKSGINVYLDGKMQSVANDHPNFNEIFEKVMQPASTAAEIRDLVDIPAAVAKYSGGRIVIDNDTFKYDGFEMHNSLTIRIIEMLKRKLPVDGLVRFMENLMLNPSFRAVNELYGFLEACTLPITPDGCFLAYKRVDQNYMSIHANPDGSHIDNFIGQTCRMPRNLVDEDPNQTCSNGLHVCSFGYLASFSGARTVVVKVNPKDVVAVPVDYNNQKMRVCEYVVVSEIPNETEIKDQYTTDQTYLDEFDDEDEDDEDESNSNPCYDCDAEDCEARDVPYRGDTVKAPATKITNVAIKPKADVGDWECRGAHAGKDSFVMFYSNMTAGQAKYKYSKDYNVPFTNVRIRKA